AEEEAGADGRAGAGAPGEQGQQRGQADQDSVPEGEVADLAFAGSGAIGVPEDETEHDQRRSDQPEVPGGVLDLVLEGESEQADRDRGDDQVPAHAGVELAAQFGAAEGNEPGPADLPEVLAEVDEDRGLGP